MFRIIIFVICLLFDISSYGVLCQSIEIQKCKEYKQDVYEEVATFGVFLYDAPELSEVEDSCVPFGPFIVGGSPAASREFPHMARLGRDTDGAVKWFCGGTLISERYVLTAAHCFYASVGEVNIVRLGEIGTSPFRFKSDYVVRRNIPHPKYIPESTELLFDDIGLIELEKRVSFSKNVHPACLPVTTGDEFKSYIAIGWGRESFFGQSSERLQKVQLEPFSYEQCQDKVSKSITEQKPTGLNRRTQMCAGSSQARDACQGDSGGPLLAFHQDFPCMYYVAGITSTGIGGCGIPNVPGIYTRVHAYVPWISDIVWNNLTN